MDQISAFDVIGAVLIPIGLAVVGWVQYRAAHDSRALWAGNKELRDKLESVAQNYVRRDDLAQHLQRLESGQDRLADKVDRLTESIVSPLARLAEACFGHRLMMDTVVPGGLTHDISAEGLAAIAGILDDVAADLPVMSGLLDSASLAGR